MGEVIPAEAVEAAAIAVYGDECADLWADEEPKVKASYLDDARLALEAAAPYIAAQALRDAVAAFPLETITAPDNAVVWLMRRAVQIEAQ